MPFAKKFQIGVYLIYVESEKSLYVGATKDFEDRVGDHKAAFASDGGHINKSLQACYNKIKQEKKLSHYQILDNYFQFIPLYCYEIGCYEKDIKSGSQVDFIVQTLESKVKKAFEDTGKFTILNIGAMLGKNLLEFQVTSISPGKENYYRKLGDMAAAEASRLESKNAFSSNLIDISFSSADEKKVLQNASRKIRPIISMKSGQFFSCYKEVCDSNRFNVRDEDLVSKRAKSDNPRLEKNSRDLRFASNEEIIAKKYISSYDSVENPGTFNNETTTFAQKVGIIGPKFPKQESLSTEEYSKLIKEIAFSCSKPKTYYESQAAASLEAKVTYKAISKWVSRDAALYEKFNMPVIWRKATTDENKTQKYSPQSEDNAPSDYDFSLEKTTRIKTDPSTLSAKAKKGLIVPSKETNKPKFIPSGREAQNYYNCSDKWIKSQMRDSEIAFLEKKTPRKFRTASLEEINSQSYIKKYDTLPLTEILEGLPKEKYRIDANIVNL